MQSLKVLTNPGTTSNPAADPSQTLNLKEKSLLIDSLVESMFETILRDKVSKDDSLNDWLNHIQLKHDLF